MYFLLKFITFSVAMNVFPKKLSSRFSLKHQIHTNFINTLKLFTKRRDFHMLFVHSQKGKFISENIFTYFLHSPKYKKENRKNSSLICILVKSFLKICLKRITNNTKVLKEVAKNFCFWLFNPIFNKDFLSIRFKHETKLDDSFFFSLKKAGENLINII